MSETEVKTEVANEEVKVEEVKEEVKKVVKKKPKKVVKKKATKEPTKTKYIGGKEIVVAKEEETYIEVVDNVGTVYRVEKSQYEAL